MKTKVVWSVVGIIVILVIFFNAFGKQYDSGHCGNPQIKGNLTTYDGEKIYHMPGQQFYDVTKAEVMFCTEEDAQKAGFRRSLR